MTRLGSPASPRIVPVDAAACRGPIEQGGWRGGEGRARRSGQEELPTAVAPNLGLGSGFESRISIGPAGCRIPLGLRSSTPRTHSPSPAPLNSVRWPDPNAQAAATHARSSSESLAAQGPYVRLPCPGLLTIYLTCIPVDSLFSLYCHSCFIFSVFLLTFLCETGQRSTGMSIGK